MKEKEILWAPWRMGYVSSVKKKGCFLCSAFKSQKDRENLVLYRGRHTFVIMNLFPYNNGHIMVATNRHIRDFERLENNATDEAVMLVKTAMKIFKRVLSAEGFNVGLNAGKIAGAGLDKHIHFHVVPRWSGDTNFMPVISDTKVVSQSLDELYQVLHKEFSRELARK